MIKGEFSEAFGENGRRRKHRQMRRIEEYEKFLTNCNIVKEKLDVEREKREREQVTKYVSTGCTLILLFRSRGATPCLMG